MRKGCGPRKIVTPSVEDFCERTTWHGVSDFYKSKGFLRVFWGLAMLLAALAAAYGCWAIVDQYMRSPVVISYMIHPADSGRRLPDVVVCPFNRFNASYLERNSIRNDLVEYIQTAFSLNTPYKFHQPAMPKNDTAQNSRLNEMLKRLGDLSFLDFIDRASFTCKSLVKYCMTQSGIIDCCANATYVITPVGKCYRLKGPYQISSGYGFGMTVMVHVPEDRYLSVGRSNLHNDGVSIKLAEQGKGLDFDLTFIPAGVHALMPLRATKYDFINDPPRYECLTNVEHSYSAIRCFDNCFFRPGMEACNCSHVTSTNRRYAACTPHQLYYCLINETMKKIKSVGHNYIRSCHTLCKPACRFWQFYPTVSYAKFPSTTFRNYVNDSENINWNKVIFLDVFYEKLEYTWIKHYPAMTPDTFVANIGGQVGLWVGGSILSLAQLMIFAIHYFCSKLFKSNGPRSTDAISSNHRSVRTGGHQNRDKAIKNGEITTHDPNTPTPQGGLDFWALDDSHIEACV